MNAFSVLLKIELRLALRSIDMLLFAVFMPVVVLIVVGLIFGGVDADFGMIEDTFGAFLAIGICAVGLMGLPLGLAEYRNRKVLKRLQVTPAHPALLLAVQVECSLGSEAVAERYARALKERYPDSPQALQLRQ